MQARPLAACWMLDQSIALAACIAPPEGLLCIPCLSRQHVTMCARQVIVMLLFQLHLGILPAGQRHAKAHDCPCVGISKVKAL